MLLASSRLYGSGRLKRYRGLIRKAHFHERHRQVEYQWPFPGSLSALKSGSSSTEVMAVITQLPCARLLPEWDNKTNLAENLARSSRRTRTKTYRNSMHKYVIHSTVIAASLSVGALSVLAQAPASQYTPQTPPAKGKYQPPAGPAPRMPDGKVDFSGNWAPNAIRQNINLASVGGEPPMLDWAEKVYKERKESKSKDDPEARCLPPGVPRMSTTPYP